MRKMGKWRKNSIITVTATSIPAAVFRLDFLKKCRSPGQGAVSQNGHDAARKLARPSFCKSPPRALRRSLRRAGELRGREGIHFTNWWEYYSIAIHQTECIDCNLSELCTQDYVRSSNFSRWFAICCGNEAGGPNNNFASLNQ